MDRKEEDGIPAAGRPATSHSALRRLNDFKAHHESFAKEFARNWRGWIVSLSLHGAIIVSLAALTLGVLVQPPPPPGPVIASYPDPAPELIKTPLDELFPDAEWDAEKDGIPSLPTGGDSPSATYVGLDGDGVPDWIGQGLPVGPVGPGGPPGDDFVGRKLHRMLDKDYKALDVVFVFDSTGSMGGIIQEVKTRIRSLTKVVTFLVPNTRLGLVTYRDKKKYDLDDYEYTVKYLPLTTPNPAGMDRINHFLRETQAYGGGDIPEAVFDGVQAAVERMEWRQGAKKVIIVFGDAPPRPEDNGLSALYSYIRKWHERTGGVLSTIDTTGGAKLMDEFRQMSTEGKGESGFLEDERGIVKQLVVYIFPKEAAPDISRVYEVLMSADKDEVLKR